ncbi:DUF4249 family protein [Pedobacter sp. N36a]|uniref:DUF4249 family protein n=1 Tax=Pedobacter sp. N36a TaxID=2767996 RepID=UPI0016570A9C|nr:DUF4249 family protein [Pedobacter sp. N36a]MBC8986812.1 DUF4249 family protein [Pedobacter sp. N36a]
MGIKFFLSIIFTVLLFGSCKKKEPAEVTTFDLIVEGGINTYNTRQYIRLSKPVSFYGENVSTVGNAIVKVNDGKNDIYFKETSSTGIYSGIVEHNKNYYGAYKLTIEYNNRQYTAVDTLKPVFPIDSNYIPASVAVMKDVLRMNIQKHTFGTSIPQQWLILTKGEMWSEEKLGENLPFSYSHVFGTPNALHPLIQQARIIDMGINDSVNIYKFSLSDPYSAYLYRLFQETDWKGLLSTVPGNVKGNISGNANGFFYATDVEMQTRPVKSLVNK